MTARIDPDQDCGCRAAILDDGRCDGCGRQITIHPTERKRYRTIVVDPPWDHSDGTGRTSHYPDGRGTRPRLENVRRVTPLPYEPMTVHEIMALPVAEIADENAHLYLWTTNRFLHDAYHIVYIWQFEAAKPLVWCKSPKAPFIGGPYGGSSVEFCLFARRGNAPILGRAGRQWWSWPRGRHSAKPDAFLDVVEQVSPGPYAELFARRARFGWDYPIGDEALGGQRCMTQTPLGGRSDA